MFIDSRSLTEGSKFEADVCIIGGGAAGITLALELGRKHLSVCLFESGGVAGDLETLDLYQGENVGLPYTFAGGCRTRYLGGSSNCWGGWCRPWSSWDFEQRSWVPNSGWPFGLQELEPHYQVAMKLLKI